MIDDRAIICYEILKTILEGISMSQEIGLLLMTAKCQRSIVDEKLFHKKGSVIKEYETKYEKIQT
jgi:hypothetical protein